MQVSPYPDGQEGFTPGREVPAFRSTSWLVLGALLRQPPDAATLAEVACVGSSAGGADPDAGEPAASWSALAEAAATAEPAPLDDEFHDLFIGIGRGELVPFASWYRTGFLMDRPLVALRRDLAILGFEREASVRDPEDHAGALAEVMGLLADPAEGQDDATQRLFFSEHIDSWMPALFADMQSAQCARFYRHVGRLGAAFVEFERGWLGVETTRAAPADSEVRPS